MTIEEALNKLPSPFEEMKKQEKKKPSLDSQIKESDVKKKD